MYRKAVALNPDSKPGLKAMYRLGFTSETYLKDYETAVFNYNEFLKKSTDAVSIYEVLKRVGNVYFENYRDPERAITIYRRLIEFNKESLEIDLFQFRIGESFFRQNNFEQARTEFSALLERFPKSALAPRAKFEIGNAYFMEGKYDIAAEALKQVGRSFPTSEFAIEAEFLLGQCLEQEQKLPQALGVYENLVGRYPTPGIIEFRITELKKRHKKEKR